MLGQQPRKTYYISVGSGEISQVKSGSTWEYKIEATDEEIHQLRNLFTTNYGNEIEGFLRAHVPYVEYHNDSSNDRYDTTLLQVFEMIYQLGDQETKDFIQSQGIFDVLRNVD
ncbi:hydrolase [Bacillus sinesaloumensis]|uniref:hydrolase n=1 Tax=Litchfieldia sinesaloumensis TaxID=1926280 RepID=UPI000988730E|nr:hydrolase [Bacillus sinesaloumensis]